MHTHAVSCSAHCWCPLPSHPLNPPHALPPRPDVVTFQKVVWLDFAVTILLNLASAQVYASFFQLVCALVWVAGLRAESDSLVAVTAAAAFRILINLTVNSEVR